MTAAFDIQISIINLTAAALLFVLCRLVAAAFALFGILAGCLAVASVACTADVIATLVGSDLAEPPQHEPDMIDLLKPKYLYTFIY